MQTKNTKAKKTQTTPTTNNSKQKHRRTKHHQMNGFPAPVRLFTRPGQNTSPNPALDASKRHLDRLYFSKASRWQISAFGESDRYQAFRGYRGIILLMEEIVQHGFIKPCKQWDIHHINWSAGFLPSTVPQAHSIGWWYVAMRKLLEAYQYRPRINSWTIMDCQLITHHILHYLRVDVYFILGNQSWHDLIKIPDGMSEEQLLSEGLL